MNKLIVAGALVVLMSGPSFALPVTVNGYMEEVLGQGPEQGTETSFLTGNGGNQNGSANGGYSNGTVYNSAVVPLPAAGWMLLAGLGGLVVLRRRARA